MSTPQHPQDPRGQWPGQGGAPDQGWAAPQQGGSQPPSQYAPPGPQQSWGDQPGAAGQPWPGQPAFGQPAPRKSGALRWLAIAGGALVALVVVAVVVGVLVGGGPEVGDCVRQADGLEVVDCGSADAEYRVVGIDEERADLTQADYLGDDSTCSQFDGITQQAWLGDLSDPSATGTIYCLGGV